MKKSIIFILISCLCQIAYSKDLRTHYSDLVLESEETSKNVSFELDRLDKDRTAFREKVKSMGQEYKRLKEKSKKLNDELAKLYLEKNNLKKELATSSKNNSEIKAVVVSSANDLVSLLKNYPVFNIDKKDNYNKSPLGIKAITDKYMEFIKELSGIELKKMKIAGADGAFYQTDVLSLGAFGNLYSSKNSYGYLITSDNTIKRALNMPDYLEKGIAEYFNGKTPEIGLDFSQGALFGQWQNKLTFKKQINNGGVLVYPIFIVALFGLFLILERFYGLFIRKLGNENQFEELVSNVCKNNWAKVDSSVKLMKDSPFGNIAQAVVSARNADKTILKNILDETLLGEVLHIERNLTLLSACAAVAPMLGLLGTVTGMIGTFHAITMYGSSDPNMMAGGISQALTTTMLGLAVAIPLMLFYTFFSRKAETSMDSLQEKGMRLLNAVEISRSDSNV